MRIVRKRSNRESSTYVPRLSHLLWVWKKNKRRPFTPPTEMFLKPCPGEGQPPLNKHTGPIHEEFKGLAGILTFGANVFSVLLITIIDLVKVEL